MDTTTWMNLKGTVLNKGITSRAHILYDSTYITYISGKTIYMENRLVVAKD